MKSKPFKNVLASAVLALIVTSPALSFGAPQGGTDGGGGNAIVCFSDAKITKKIYSTDNPHRGTITEDMLKSITSVETYDLAYAELPTLERQPTIVPIGANEGFDDYARRIAARAAVSAPEIKWIVEAGLQALKYQKALIRQNGVMTVSDMADVGVVDTNKCVVSTMAVQVLDSQNPLNLDGRLFRHPKHSRQSQAILILHEILYAAARKHFNATNSSSVRELIRMIATEGAGYTKKDITALMANNFVTGSTPQGLMQLPSVTAAGSAIAILRNQEVALVERYSELAPRAGNLDAYQILFQLGCANEGMKKLITSIEWGEETPPAVSVYSWEKSCRDVDTSNQVLMDMYPTAKAVWSELLEEQTKNRLNWTGKQLMANGLKDTLDKMQVTADEQALLQYYFDRNLKYAQRPTQQQWQTIDEILRTSDVVLP